MPRGYRGILAAIAGLNLAGQAPPPKEGEQHIQATAHSEVAQAPPPIAPSIQNPVSSVEQTKEYNPPCDKGDDNRKSDLCAQWKAADAARDAANYALSALLVGIVGTGLLVWTLCETRLTSRRQLRAYLSTRPLGISCLIGKKECLGHVELENVGQTPAFKVWIKVKAHRAADKEWRPTDYPPEPAEVGRTLHPGGKMSIGSQKPYIPIDQIDAATKYAELPYIYIWGIARYQDIFGKMHTTNFCYRYETGSREQASVTHIKGLKKGPRKAVVIFTTDKARHQSHGNEAD